MIEDMFGICWIFGLPGVRPKVRKDIPAGARRQNPGSPPGRGNRAPPPRKRREDRDTGAHKEGRRGLPGSTAGSGLSDAAGEISSFPQPMVPLLFRGFYPVCRGMSNRRAMPLEGLWANLVERQGGKKKGHVQKMEN